MSDREAEALDGLEKSIDIVARHILGRLVDSDDLGEMWELYPEIGSDDWERVVEVVQELVPEIHPTDSTYEAAYNFLAERANHDLEELP